MRMEENNKLEEMRKGKRIVGLLRQPLPRI
jgi:hypothetical protein